VINALFFRAAKQRLSAENRTKPVITFNQSQYTSAKKISTFRKINRPPLHQHAARQHEREGLAVF